MKNITILRATHEHAKIIAPLFDRYRDFYKQQTNITAAENFLTSRIIANESIVFIAVHDETAVGFAQIYPTFSSFLLTNMWVLNDLFIEEHMRKQNIGRLLLEHIMTTAKSTGIQKLTLKTDKCNVVAQGLYTATGWVKDDIFVSFNYCSAT